MSRTTDYDNRVILLDINFIDISLYRLDVFLAAKKLLAEITANQNLIILTDNNNPIANKVIDELGLKTGFLITNSGTDILDVTTKKSINSSFLSQSLVKQMCYKCIWNNLLFSIHTNDEIYPYKAEYWLINKYKSNLSYLNDYYDNNLQTADDIKTCIFNNQIKKLEIYFIEANTKKRQEQMLQFIEIFKDFEIDYSINISCLNIVPKGSTKSEGVGKIIEILNKTEWIYCGINQYDKIIADKSYFSIISNELTADFNYSKTTELLDCGVYSWIQWFKDNKHLWNGMGFSCLIEKLSNHKNCQVIKKDILSLKIGETNHIYLEENETQTRLNLWPKQVSAVINFIAKNDLYNKKGL